MNEAFRKNNPDFDSNSLKEYIITLGKEHSWFSDTIDLRDLLVDKINKKYEKYNISIGIAIRCLPDSYRRRSFVRYTKSDNYLTIDFCVSVEEYETKYAVEQQFELGKTFLLWLDKGQKEQQK